MGTAKILNRVISMLSVTSGGVVPLQNITPDVDILLSSLPFISTVLYFKSKSI